MARTGLLVGVVLVIGCGGGGAGDDGDDDVPDHDAAVDPADAADDPVDGDGIGPGFVSATPPTGTLIDWTQPIVLEWDAPIDGVVEVDGTMVGEYDVVWEASTLTLTPQTGWNADSARTLTVIVRDADGDQGEVALSYDVLDWGVHVHPAGAAGNPGTRSEPLPTIADGIMALMDFYGYGEVRVAEGTYQEHFTVPTDVDVIGGFDAADWSTSPSRALYPTIVDDQRTGVGNPYTVILAADSAIRRLVVRSASGVTGTCAAVSLDDGIQGHQIVDDCELEARTCTTANGIRSTQPLDTVEVLDSLVRGTGTPGTSKTIQLALDGGTPSIQIVGSEIRAAPGATLESAGIDVAVNVTAPATGTVSVTDSHVRGGGGSDGAAGRSYGISLAAPNLVYTIEANRIHGGTAAIETTGVRVGATGTSTTLARNAIHGGEPQLDDRDATGVRVLGQASIRNNLISGGGRVHGSITAGDSIGIIVTTTSALVANNTIHLGFLGRGAAVRVGSAGTSIRNNVLFTAGALAGGFTSAIHETSATADPVDLRSNRVMGFGAASAVLYQDHVGSGGTCSAGTAYNCYLLEADLVDESHTTQGAAGTADGSTVGSAGLEDVDGPDGLLQTLFDDAGALENDWSLAAASVIKTTGLDGAAAGFGFTDDHEEVARTGNGTTGWSIGAYERDD